MAIIDLPCGVQIGPGRVERSIEIKKLSGKVQRDANNDDNKKNAGLLIDAFLNPSIIKVGEKPVLSTTVQDMLVSDRDFVLFDLVRVTTGNKVQANYECRVCKGKMAQEVLIDQLPVTRLDEATTGWWNGEKVVFAAETTPEDLPKLKQRAFALGGKDDGYSAVFRYPNGRDQRKITVERVRTQPVDVIQMLMSDTLLQINGKDRPQKGFPIEVWDDVDLDILVKLQQSWAEAQPGIDSTIQAECDKGHANTVHLQAQDFLSPGAAPTN